MMRELREKYNKARAAFLKHHNVSPTNLQEQNNMEIAKAALELFFPKSQVISTGDGWLNYLGADFIVATESEAVTVDLKVGKMSSDDIVLIDAYKKGMPAIDYKITQYFLFINKNYVILADAAKLPLPDESECFYLVKDLYKTTQKAYIQIPDEAKLHTALLSRLESYMKSRQQCQ